MRPDVDRRRRPLVGLALAAGLFALPLLALDHHPAPTTSHAAAADLRGAVLTAAHRQPVYGPTPPPVVDEGPDWQLGTPDAVTSQGFAEPQATAAAAPQAAAVDAVPVEAVGPPAPDPVVAEPAMIAPPSEPAVTAPAPTFTAPEPAVNPVSVAAPVVEAPAPQPVEVSPLLPEPAGLESGLATWYGAPAGTCAHKTLPFGTIVTVTSDTGASTTCVVADRGPYAAGRVIDLAKDVFSQIAPLGAGVVPVTLSW